MKRFPILTTTAAVLALMTAGSFAAPKKKTAGDTAKAIIDALLGDDKQPAPAQGKAGAGLAGNVAQFSGKWNIEDGSGAITVKAVGTAAQVHWDFAKGGGDDGVGIERGGKFYIGYGGVAGPGILVFQMAVGKLTGVGAVSKGGVPAAFTETLTGPAGLNGQYMSSRGEKVGIAPAANDSYLVIWTKTKRAGFGKKIGNELVVAFDDRDVANANLVVYSPGANKLDGVFWTTLGKEGGNENLLRPAGVPFAIAGRPRVDRFGNVIPDGPPPAGLEKPIDLPVAPIAPAVPPAVIGKPAVVGKRGQPGKPVPAPAAALGDQQAAFMAVHNNARAEVGVGPLQWDPRLASYAQEWADQLARSGKFDHRPNGKYGENLAGFHPPDGPDAGARMWLAEKKDFRGEKIDDRNFMKVGHYTQMVWRGTQRVGYGAAKNAKGMWILVANYEPAGNMIGEHPYAGGPNVAVAPPPAGAPAAPAPAPAAPAVGIPGPAAPVVGGIGVQFPKEWTNTQNGKTVTSVSPDGSARVIITTVSGDGADGPWDDVQSKMAKHLAPHFPGLTDLAEVSTEHDVIRDGVGLRVVTYTAKFNGAAVDIVVDFARENNVDGKGLVLIIRCSEQGNAANQAGAKKTAESLRLRK